MNIHTQRMVELARSYCDLIEDRCDRGSYWLGDLARLLPKLHVAVEALEIESACYHHINMNLDERFELFYELRNRLGTHDGYWVEYDVAVDGQLMSGSLADDLADIYCELKGGLRLADEEPELAIYSWCFGFRAHWGQHLVDALRHLYTLGQRNHYQLRH